MGNLEFIFVLIIYDILKKIKTDIWFCVNKY